MKPIASSHNLAAGAAAESLCDDVAWLHELVLEFLISEAADKASFETGGLLMGYLSASQGVPVILLASGPGPRAVHSRTRYRPDYQYDEARVAQVYEQSQGRVLYLGDWHTHPETVSALSRKDQRALGRVARCRAARIPSPLMGVLHFTDSWGVRVWRGRLTRRRLWRDRLTAVPLRVQAFS